MPSDVCDSDLHRSRTDKTPHESLSPIRVFPERSGTSKYPVIWFLVRCVLPPCPQRFRQVSIERNWFLRSLGLARSNYLKHDRPCDADLVCLEVDITPFQSKSSLIRKPVPASSKTRVRSRSPGLAISCGTSLALSTVGNFFRFAPCRTNRIGLYLQISCRIPWLKSTLMIFLIFAQLDFANASDLSQSSTSPALMRLRV